MFVSARLASLIIRAIMSKQSLENINISLLIAELTLISVGYLFLIEPIIGSWKRLIDHHNGRQGSARWPTIVQWTLVIVLVITIVLSVVAGAIVSKAFDNPGELKTIVHLREASYILSLSKSCSLQTWQCTGGSPADSSRLGAPHNHHPLIPRLPARTRPHDVPRRGMQFPRHRRGVSGRSDVFDRRKLGSSILGGILGTSDHRRIVSHTTHDYVVDEKLYRY